MLPLRKPTTNLPTHSLNSRQKHIRSTKAEARTLSIRMDDIVRERTYVVYVYCHLCREKVDSAKNHFSEIAP